MGYLTVNDRGQISQQQLGANLFAKVFGGGDNIKQYEARGDSLAKIYADWKPDLLRYADDSTRIPTGSGKHRLDVQKNKLFGMVPALDAAFAPGSTPGAADRDLLNSFVGGIKDLGKDLDALIKQYGLRPSAPNAAAGAKHPGLMTAGAIGGIPLWGWGLALFAAAKLFGNKK